MFRNSKQMLRLGINHCVKPKSMYSTTKTEQVTASSDEGIGISDTCVKRLKDLCERDGDSFLRLAVESGGCSGFQYKFDIDNKLEDEDRIFQRDGVKVVIDETSLDYIKGSTIDYHTELIRSAFRVVKNPNADIGCSCGASFSVKID